MKVILNVSERSFYSKYNGHTFEVLEMLSTVVKLKLPLGQQPDFSFREIRIVDLDLVMEESFHDSKKKAFIIGYMKVNSIKLLEE